MNETDFQMRKRNLEFIKLTAISRTNSAHEEKVSELMLSVIRGARIDIESFGKSACECYNSILKEETEKAVYTGLFHISKTSNLSEQNKNSRRKRKCPEKDKSMKKKSWRYLFNISMKMISF